MHIFRYIALLHCFVPFIFLASGCISFEKTGASLGRGLMTGVETKADTTMRTAMGGIGGGLRDSVLTDETRLRITMIVDDAMRTLTDRGIVFRDTLLGEELQILLDEAVRSALGETTRQYVADIRDEFFGETTLRYLTAWRDTLLSDETVGRAGMMRDELLGPKTAVLVQSIADSVLIATVRQYEDRLRPGMQADLTLIQEYATQILVIAAVLTIGVIAFFWWQRRKYRKLLNVVAFQIHEIPDRDLYDELTKRIQRKAQEEGVEPDLRKILGEQGILGEEAWRPAN